MDLWYDLAQILMLELSQSLSQRPSRKGHRTQRHSPAHAGVYAACAATSLMSIDDRHDKRHYERDGYLYMDT